jgi:TRAP-type mannitol/chloroaromatic compound transport system permease large subunit
MRWLPRCGAKARVPSAGLWMLAVLAVLIAGTGLPVWVLLIGVASGAAALGVAGGVIDTAVLGSLYPRTVNLLEHDLLQAMPLYVFIGVLLQRLPVADALFRCLARMLRGTGAGSALAALGTGALIAPMNGSVASSSALLSRLVAPRLHAMPKARALALVAAAATIGIVVPPSLVLLLLGDAMLRAHTEASNLAAAAFAGQRIINTQDVLHAALLPALAVLIAWSLVAWRQGRSNAAGGPAIEPPIPLSGRDVLLASCAVLGVLLLLAGVFTGRLLAVEAAATGGCLLALLAAVFRSLDVSAWRAVLEDTLALGGALFALLVGATTFSLVFSVFGTGAWLAQSALESGASPLLLLAVVAGCAWILDAFELIFVIVPVVAPVLVLQLGDAQQAAVLLLLVLQAGFLLPPLGYAVLMARSAAGSPALPRGALLRAVAPYLAVQLLVGAAVFAFPAAVHQLDAAAGAVGAQESDEDLKGRMRDMGPSSSTEDGPTQDVPAAPVKP